MTVPKVVRAFLAHTSRQTCARTHEWRTRILTAFVEAYPTLALIEAKPFHLRLWVDGNPAWRSDWTKKGVIAAVQRCFNWSVKLGMIERNPFAGVSHPEGEPGRAMADKEFRAALRDSTAPFRRVLIFLRLTGCRPGELCGLTPSMIDLGRSLAILERHKTARKTKRPRVIVLHPVALKLVRYLMRTMIPDQQALFIHSRGGPWTRYSIACRMKRLRKRLGLPADCRLYGLRHKFGTDGIRNKVELKTLSVLMGHTSTRTTERYVHIENDFELLGDAVRKIIKPP